MMHRWKALILLYLGGYVVQSHDYISERNRPMYTQNGWWFLSSGGAYPPVFTVVTQVSFTFIITNGAQLATAWSNPEGRRVDDCLSLEAETNKQFFSAPLIKKYSIGGLIITTPNIFQNTFNSIIIMFNMMMFLKHTTCSESKKHVRRVIGCVC